jgi:hypothetical protein
MPKGDWATVPVRADVLAAVGRAAMKLGLAPVDVVDMLLRDFAQFAEEDYRTVVSAPRRGRVIPLDQARRRPRQSSPRRDAHDERGA